MTTDELLEAIAGRTILLVIRDGKLLLMGDDEDVTPALLNVVRWHEEEIIRRLTQNEVRRG